MSRYSHETPMDFEFQNGTGPIDGRSPFAALSTNTQRFAAQGMDTHKKRTYSAFDSSTKQTRMGSKQSSPSKPLPLPPAFNSLYNTPRKLRDDFDDSSAGETPNSAQRDDSDATPDNMNLRSPQSRFDFHSMPTITSGERNRDSPMKERPTSQRQVSVVGGFITKFKSKFNSPGRGEVPRADCSHTTGSRVEKRRKREVDRRVARRRRHSMTDSEADNDNPSSKSPRKLSSSQQIDPNRNKPHWISALFTFISQHPTVPHILSFYAQLAFNVFLLGGCGYLIYCFWSAVQGDVDEKSHEAMVGIIAEMKVCADSYAKNNCDPATRMPALEGTCEAWLKCANQDPRKVGRAKVSARTFAEIFNSFVEPISYKAMLFTFILVFGCFAISNLAFGFFRNKTEQYQQAPYFGYGHGAPPPPTPQRGFSEQSGDFYAGTPWRQQPLGTGFEPQPSAGFGQIEGRGSPVKRLTYD